MGVGTYFSFMTVTYNIDILLILLRELLAYKTYYSYINNL